MPFLVFRYIAPVAHKSNTPLSKLQDGFIFMFISEMVKLLLKYNIDISDCLLHAVKVHFVEAVSALCEQCVLAKVMKRLGYFINVDFEFEYVAFANYIAAVSLKRNAPSE